MKRLALPLSMAMAMVLLMPVSASSSPAVPQPPLQGRVTAVDDSAHLTVTVPGQPPVRLTLRDIETPGPCQPGGAAAREALVAWALDKPAVVHQLGRRDAQGRALASVRVDEMDLSRRMVEEGFAWSTRSKWDRGPLVREERMAHSLRRGLHADAAMLSPTEFRRRHGACAAAATPP